MDQISCLASPILLSVFSNTGPYKKKKQQQQQHGRREYDDLEKFSQYDFKWNLLQKAW